MEQFIDAVLLRADLTGVFETKQLSVLRSILQEECDRYKITPRQNELIAPDLAVPVAYKAFMVIKKTEGLSDQSLRVYKCVMESFFLSMLKPLDAITQTDIQLYLYKKQTEDNNTVTSANNIRNYLSSFFSWSVDNGYLASNPMKNVKRIKGLAKAYVPLTYDQFEICMSKTQSLRERAILSTFAASGIRISELCSLSMNRLDLANGTFYIVGKGNKERICFLTPRAKQDLTRYIREERKGDSDKVFVSQRKPYNGIGKTSVTKFLEEMSDRVGFRVHPHMFRHYFADSAHDAGIDVVDIGRMLGHASIKITEIYLTKNESDLQSKHSRLK